MKTLTLKRIGYTIKGVSDLTHWGGGNACIIMDRFIRIQTWLQKHKKTIRKFKIWKKLT
jgi:hypothetical protein